MLSTVHFLQSSILVLIFLLLVNCDGRAIIKDVSANLTARIKAEEHFRMIERRVCSSPVPKLFPVDDIYPIIDGNYKPHCVELYRCDKDAGCCKGDTEICAPQAVEIVHLHVSVTGLFETKVLLMPFENHTKCECQPLREVLTDWR
ncbi:PDGF_2 domain-containing protein [Nephila pilipes]|uniref:PDGF_2 domain-containing protein n=1 Tax=Nephila pilipes TaxID=299642 RepID=A0A8X6QKR4_NEPPI|nr:PDGF_2 domain-containing protein [Nephila pilipes]